MTYRLGGGRSIQLSYGDSVSSCTWLSHFWPRSPEQSKRCVLWNDT